jgi:hypothetical protein
VSPRTDNAKIGSDDSSLASDQIEMIKSITQMNTAAIDSSSHFISVDQTIQEDSSEVVNSLVDQIEMTLLPASTHLVHQQTQPTTAVMDDGYGSTASMKNTITNESMSSFSEETSLAEAAKKVVTILESLNDDATVVDSVEMFLPNSNELAIKKQQQQVHTDLDETDEMTLVEEASVSMSSLRPETLVAGTAEAAGAALVVEPLEPSKEAELFLEKTLSFTKDSESKSQLDEATSTENNQFISIEQLENSMKLVELEPVAAGQIMVEKQEDKQNIESVESHKAEEVCVEQVATVDQSIHLENASSSVDVTDLVEPVCELPITAGEQVSQEEKEQEQKPIHTIKIEENLNEVKQIELIENKLKEDNHNEDDDDDEDDLVMPTYRQPIQSG